MPLKKIFTLLFISATVLLTNYDDAKSFPREGKSYISLNGGYGFYDAKLNISGLQSATLNSQDRGVVFDASLGYYILDELRISVNPIYVNNFKGKKSNGNNSNYLQSNSTVDEMGAFLDLHYDLLTKGDLNPFIMGGVGLLRVQYQDTLTAGGSGTTMAVAKNTRTKLGFQGGAGVAYHYNSTMDFELTYKVLKQMTSKKNKTVNYDFSNIGYTGSSKPGYTQMLLIGVRYLL